MKTLVKILPIILLTLTLAAQTPVARVVKLIWDANPPEENILYYSVKWSSTSGGPYLTVTNVTTTNATVILKGGRNFFIVTAVNNYAESDPSQEVYRHIAPGQVKNIKAQ